MTFFSFTLIRFGWQMVEARWSILSNSLNGRCLSFSVSYCRIIFIFSLWAITTQTFQATVYDDIIPELCLLILRLSCGCPVPQDLSQCCRLDLLQVTDSNLPHTDFWDDPLPFTTVPKIICSRSSWESCDVSSSWSLRFMNRSRCFPERSQLDLWRVCTRGPSRAKPSLAGPELLSLSSNAEISTVSRSGFSSLFWKCQCSTETIERMKASARVTHLKRRAIDL